MRFASRTFRRKMSKKARTRRLKQKRQRTRRSKSHRMRGGAIHFRDPYNSYANASIDSATKSTDPDATKTIQEVSIP